VFDARQTNSPVKLTMLGLYTLDTYQPDINTTSNPTGYFLFGDDPSTAVSAVKQTQIGFFPCPDAVYNIQFRYFMETTDLVNTTDITIIPPEHVGVLLAGMEWLGCKYINDPSEDDKLEMYEAAVQRMIEKTNQNGDWMPVLQSSDSNTPSPYLQMPGNFPSPNSGDY
jgi:hypothetical protein